MKLSGLFGNRLALLAALGNFLPGQRRASPSVKVEVPERKAYGGWMFSRLLGMRRDEPLDPQLIGKLEEARLDAIDDAKRRAALRRQIRAEKKRLNTLRTQEGLRLSRTAPIYGVQWRGFLRRRQMIDEAMEIA